MIRAPRRAIMIYIYMRQLTSTVLTALLPYIDGRASVDITIATAQLTRYMNTWRDVTTLRLAWYVKRPTHTPVRGWGRSMLQAWYQSSMHISVRTHMINRNTPKLMAYWMRLPSQVCWQTTCLSYRLMRISESLFRFITISVHTAIHIATHSAICQHIRRWPSMSCHQIRS